MTTSPPPISGGAERKSEKPKPGKTDPDRDAMFKNCDSNKDGDGFPSRAEFVGP